MAGKEKEQKEGTTGVKKMLKQRAHGQGRVCDEQTDAAGQRIHREGIQALSPSASDLTQILLVLGSGTSNGSVLQ